MPLARDKSIRKIKQLRKRRRLAVEKERPDTSHVEEGDASSIGVACVVHTKKGNGDV